MLYALVDIDRYERGKVQYFLTAWMILIIPSAIVAILVVTPYPRSFRRFRHRWSDKEPCRYILEGWISALTGGSTKLFAGNEFRECDTLLSGGCLVFVHRGHTTVQ